jgi:hypothetical protein
MVTNIVVQISPPKTKDALEAKLANIARILTEQQQQQHIPGFLLYRGERPSGVHTRGGPT